MSFKLVTLDNQEFLVDQCVINQSKLLKNMLEDVGSTNDPIPITNIKSNILGLVIDYANHHKNESIPTTEEEERAVNPDEWDTKFLSEMSKETLCDLIMAANFLDMKKLLNLGCKTVADMIKYKSVKEIEDLFGCKQSK